MDKCLISLTSITSQFRSFLNWIVFDLFFLLRDSENDLEFDSQGVLSVPVAGTLSVLNIESRVELHQRTVFQNLTIYMHGHVIFASLINDYRGLFRYFINLTFNFCN